MDIPQIAKRLNEKAKLEGFMIAELPELRKKYLGKKKLPAKIFSSKTIFREFAFHHGGRDEIQFNFGEDFYDNKKCTRYGLCFSLESSKSLQNPVEDLEPFRKRFNHCFESHPELFSEFKIWYEHNGKASNHFASQLIPDEWFQYGNFISIGNIIMKPFDELDEGDLTEILEGFDKLLPIYKFCVLTDSESTPKLKIFTRLTSNENKWELPSPHKWKKENQGKKNIPFENQYGFGHEEWLFNPRYNIKGFQYGYIRGLDSNNRNLIKYDEIHFYTVKKHKTENLVYYLGYIKNVYANLIDEADYQSIREKVEDFNNDRIKEVESVNGDVKGITSFPFETVAKFKIEDAFLLEDPIYQPNFDLGRYKRFQPYKILSSVQDIFEGLNEIQNIEFISGKSTQTNVYNRKNKESSITIEKLHSEIVNSLETYLKPTYCLDAENISIEKTRFHGNIADVVTQEDDSSISIYEIKTTSSGRRNIRDAIAQLLDYALHSSSLQVNKLIIVSPVLLNNNELAFLSGLREKLLYPIEYMSYQKEGIKKFIYQ